MGDPIIYAFVAFPAIAVGYQRLVRRVFSWWLACISLMKFVAVGSIAAIVVGVLANIFAVLGLHVIA